jgi:hypothetical protein
MKSKRSRFALVAMLVLALSVTVGLVFGSVADAKKKKKKSANVATVSNNTPRAIPDRPPGNFNTPEGRLDTTLTVGKKFKGKTVGALEITFQTTGDYIEAAAELQVDITAPNGYRLPGDWWDNSFGGQNVGPLTVGPNSPFRTCNTATPPCSDPFQTLNRPFVGTVGDNTFQWFRGLPMKGNWVVTVTDDEANHTSVLNMVRLKITAA